MKFKNFEEYKTLRDSLIAEAESLLASADRAGYDAKVKEVNDLDTEFENFRTEQANLNALKDKAPKMPATLENMKGTENMENQNKVNEVLYRDAFFNYLRGEKLNREQNEAFEARNGFKPENVLTTTTEAAALPMQTLDMIWDLCGEQHSILDDIDMRRTGVAIKVVKRTSITGGKGSKKTKEQEGKADTLLVDVKIPVELTGHDFSATVELSYAAAKMAISALEEFIAKDVADQVGWAMAKDVVDTIEASMNADNKVDTVGNEFTYEELAKTFGKCKRCHGLMAYVSNTTLYNYLVAMVDLNGRPIFQPNAQDGAKGSVIGAVVRLEEAVADGKILVGDPKRVIGNVVQDIMVETDRDIKNHTVIYSAYARMEAELIDDQSFASLTATVA